ncbi:MAG: DUF6785 family protein, partial [Planctomycetota bacterium]
MTLRAFIVGVFLVLVLCVVDTYTSCIKGYAWNTFGHFPQACVFLLVVLTVLGNVGLSLLRRRWALRQPELMLIWCMLIVAAITPSAGLQAHWPGLLPGPAYLARRADIAWKDTALAEAPEGLLLSKNPKDEAARQYFEGAG